MRAAWAFVILGAWCLGSGPSRDPLAQESLALGTEGLGIPAAVRANKTPLRTITLLAEATATASPERKLRLIRDLGRTRHPAALPALGSLCKDGDVAVRTEVAAALGELGAFVPVERTLAQLASDKSPQVRLAALRGMTSLGLATDSYTNDADPQVAAAAIRGSRLDDAQLVAFLRPGDDPRTVAALRALARLDGGARPVPPRSQAAIEKLQIFLAGTLEQKLLAMEAMADSRAQAEPLLRPLLSDEQPAVRRLAVRLVGGDRDAATALNDADATVRRAGCDKLSGRAAGVHLPKILSLLTQDDSSLVDAACRAAASAPGAVAADLAKAFASGDPRLRRAAARIAGYIGTTTYSTQLRQLLTDSDLSVVAEAAAAMDRTTVRDAGDDLVKALRQFGDASRPARPSPELDARRRALSAVMLACGQIGVAQAAAPLASIWGDATRLAPMRSQAIWAYGRCATLPADQGSAGKLLGIYDAFLETEPVKIEAIKALGHMRAAFALARLEKIAAAETSNDLKWLAHWACGRITGKPTPYAPLTIPWTASVSIQSLE